MTTLTLEQYESGRIILVASDGDYTYNWLTDSVDVEQAGRALDALRADYESVHPRKCGKLALEIGRYKEAPKVDSWRYAYTARVGDCDPPEPYSDIELDRLRRDFNQPIGLRASMYSSWTVRRFLATIDAIRGVGVAVNADDHCSGCQGDICDDCGIVHDKGYIST